MLHRLTIVFKINEYYMFNYNHEYKLLKEIYNNMSKIDKNKAKQLHEQGFKNGNRKYKNFMLDMRFFNVFYLKEGIYISPESEIHLNISGRKDIVDFIVKSTLSNGLSIDDLKFKCISCFQDKSYKPYKKTLYKIVKPIVCSVHTNNKKIYLNWLDKTYLMVIKNNLLRKYKTIYKEDYKEDLEIKLCNVDPYKVKKKTIRNIKDKGFLIGYCNFQILLQANNKMQEIAYYLGLGQNNTLGCGVLEQIGYIKE